MKVFMATVFAFGMSACGLDAQQGTSDQAATVLEPTPEVAMADLDPVVRAKVEEKIAEKLAANPDVVAAPQHATCGRAGPNRENFFSADASSPNAVNQRSGSSTGCVAVGQMQPTHDAIYFCFTFANDGFTWTYLQRVGGNRGWVRDDLLRDFGSFVHCGF